MFSFALISTKYFFTHDLSKPVNMFNNTEYYSSNQYLISTGTGQYIFFIYMYTKFDTVWMFASLYLKSSLWLKIEISKPVKVIKLWYNLFNIIIDWCRIQHTFLIISCLVLFYQYHSWMLLNDGFALYAFNNRHCKLPPVKLSHTSVLKW